MSNPRLLAETPAILNELGRVAVALSETARTDDLANFVAVTFDAPLGVAEAKAEVLHLGEHVLPGGAPLPYAPEGSLRYALYRDRAARADNRTLCVRGRVIDSQHYMQLWEQAFRDAVSPEQFASMFGLRVLLTFGARLQGVRGSRSSTPSAPFKSFSRFERAYGDRFSYHTSGDGEEFFELTLDLREPNAAPVLFHTEEFVGHHASAARQYMRARLEALDPRAAPPMFVSRQASFLDGSPP
ncbi:hypothetical protein [Ottowia sp.]|uniref:hypothetical protein n=1 Tax=Ottowia sp. TaxID=1898956 RepID=UPI0026155B4D|nr:hypothetical protein [Ottowia sp.]